MEASNTGDSKRVMFVEEQKLTAYAGNNVAVTAGGQTGGAAAETYEETIDSPQD